MFERYTEKARRVIFFARYEASEFGNPEIGPEFLLLGLLREEPYIVTRWLGEGDWQTTLREEVAKRVYTGPKTSTAVDLPLTNAAGRVLGYAAEEAQRMNNPNIGTEHLFLALLLESESSVKKMLENYGVDINKVRSTLAKEGQKQISSVITSGSSVRTPFRKSISFGFQAALLVEGEDAKTPLEWSSRVPSIGETLLFESGEYQVTDVQWKVTKNPEQPLALSGVVIQIKRIGGYSLVQTKSHQISPLFPAFSKNLKK